MKTTIILITILFFSTNSKAQNEGKDLYLQHCAVCHNANRIGKIGPPLIPVLLRKYKMEALQKSIKNGFPQTLMPTFNHLDSTSIYKIAAYIKSPILEDISWNKEDIEASIEKFNDPIKDLNIQDMEQVLPVVERDGGFVWIMENEKILDKFPLKNIHGGIKYQFPNAENIYIPTRDGWVEKYSLKEGRRIAKIRAGIHLRNVSLTRDGKFMMVSTLLPEQIVMINAESFKVEKIIPVEGKISAIYEYYSQDKAIFTFRNKPLVGKINTKTFDLEYFDIKEPIEDYFIDPYDKFLIATARHGKLLRVYDIENLSLVFEQKMEGMPHLFSATYWYENGKFYFATPHLKRSFITIWQMYDWKFVKQIEIGGDGFFVKTHPNSPYLWIDNGTDELILINKKNYKKKKIVPVEGKQYIHTEFTGNGKFAYLSIYEHDGSIEVWNTETLEKLYSYSADIPVGKYNFINKNRKFYPRLFGLDIYNQKCKGDIDCMKNLKKMNSYEKIAIDDFLQSR